jgi:hypothetical protein
MTEKVEAQKELKEKPKPKSAWSSDEKKLIGTNYGCQLIAEDATDDQLKDKNYPTDTMVVSYQNEGKVLKDLCRGSQVKIFDLYFDKFGKDSVKAIDFGKGTLKPSQWGYKPPEKKRKRKS